MTKTQRDIRLELTRDEFQLVMDSLYEYKRFLQRIGKVDHFSYPEAVETLTEKLVDIWDEFGDPSEEGLNE